MTFVEYVTYQPPAGYRDELIHGELILSPPANTKHADLCFTLCCLLEARVLPEFVARLDTTHHLGEREGPRPDIFVIRRDRWITAGRQNTYPEGSPELAIEVWSESNTEREMKTKRDLYFSDPRCTEVWELKVDASNSLNVYRYACIGAVSVYGNCDSVPLPGGIGMPGTLIAVKEMEDGILS